MTDHASHQERASSATRIRISLAQQIEEIEFQLRQARGPRIVASADARMHVLRLEATLETLKLIRQFEGDVRAVIRHGLDLKAREQDERQADVAASNPSGGTSRGAA
ncbi:MAG: hypothetical protein ABL908_12480 [Hyphomicrobium sp.]